MDNQSKYGVISIIFSIIAIILSWDKDFLIVSITVGTIAIAFAYLSAYIKQIKENSKKLNKLEEEFEMNKRLIRIEEYINNIKKRKLK